MAAFIGISYGTGWGVASWHWSRLEKEVQAVAAALDVFHRQHGKFPETLPHSAGALAASSIRKEFELAYHASRVGDSYTLHCTIQGEWGRGIWIYSSQTGRWYQEF